jgi:hypothetical protein
VQVRLRPRRQDCQSRRYSCLNQRHGSRKRKENAVTEGRGRGRKSESKKREQSQKEKGVGTVEGKTWQKKDAVERLGNAQASTSSAMCTKRMRRKKQLTSRESSAEKADDLPRSAIEVGVGILVFDLLDNPPGRHGERDMVAPASGHAGVEKTDHITHAIDDERARIAFGGEIAGLLVVVIYGEFHGLLPKIIGEVGLQACVPSHGEIARASVL